MNCYTREQKNGVLTMPKKETFVTFFALSKEFDQNNGTVLT